MTPPLHQSKAHNIVYAAVPIERQDSIASAVEKEQFFLLIDGQPARVCNTRVVVTRRGIVTRFPS